MALNSSTGTIGSLEPATIAETMNDCEGADRHGRQIALKHFKVGLFMLAASPVWLWPSVGHAEAKAPRPRHHPVALVWVFAIHDGQDLTPRGKVFLSVGGRRELVEADAQYHFQVVSRGMYPEHAVPSSALCACSGWWAGGGEDLYVIRRGNRLKVYRRWLDEQSGIFPYRLIRSFSMP